MNGRVKGSGTGSIKQSEAPELDDDFFEQASLYNGDTLVRRGRPKADKTKRRVTMRLDPEIVDSFKAAGPGWQTRMNRALHIFLEEHNPADL